MSATLTGTPTAITWAAGANPAGQSITIPSDATAVYFFWSYYSTTGASGLSSVTLNSAAPDQTFEIATGTNLTASGVAVWYNPSTGSQTLDPAWDVSPGEGPTSIVVYVRDGDTTAWRDADGDQDTGATAVTVTLTTAATDLVLKYDQHFGSGPGTSSGWTYAQVHANGGEAAKLSYVQATTTTQVCNSENENYSTVIAISIPDDGGVTPFIETSDCTVSGSNTASGSWAVSHPAAATGDLLIFNVAWDDSTTTTSVTAPAGPNSEVLTSIEGPVVSSSDEVRCQSWYTVATGSWSASTVAFTPSANESWSATVIKVPAGEFDGTTPIGANSSVASAGSESAVDSPAFTAGASDGNGRLVWFAAVDTDPLSATNPTGCVILQTQDLGAVAHGVAIRNAPVSNSESIAAITDWAIAGDTWASIAYVVRSGSDTVDDLTANDVESDSEVSAPAIGQVHALNATDVQSTSNVTSPALHQVHALTANDVESDSELTAPVLGLSNVLLANDVESASEVTTPVIAQVHALNAADVQSVSQVTAPVLAQVHALNATDVESASQVTAPVVTQIHVLNATDVQSASQVTSPAVGQIHALNATDVESDSELTAPTLAESGDTVDDLLADDVESASQVTAPVLAQVHALTATSVESASELSAPALAEVSDAIVEPEQPSGGWGFLNYYESELQIRKARQRRRKKLEEETEEIQDELDRAIAQLLREQEAIDERKAELQRLGDLARKSADIAAAKAYSEGVAKAYEAAIEKGTTSALDRLDRELRKAREDEEWVLLSVFML